MTRAIVVVLLTFIVFAAGAEEIDAQRAHYNYMLYCQGCHTPDGRGIDSVPRLKDHVGYFLQIPQGRDYLVRVPGSAGSVLDNEQLAEVLNWLILEFGGESVPEDFTPYTAEEIATLRNDPLLEVAEYRRRLIQELSDSKE